MFFFVKVVYYLAILYLIKSNNCVFCMSMCKVINLNTYSLKHRKNKLNNQNKCITNSNIF